MQFQSGNKTIIPNVLYPWFTGTIPASGPFSLKLFSNFDEPILPLAHHTNIISFLSSPTSFLYSIHIDSIVHPQDIDVLTKGLQWNISLKELVLPCVELDACDSNEFLKVLGRLSQLEFLDISFNNLTHSQLKSYWDGLTNQTKTNYNPDPLLVLNPNEEKKFNRHHHRHHLKVLNLSFNEFGTEGAHIIVDMLIQSLLPLEELYLEGCGLHDFGVRDIIHAIQQNDTSTLKILHLGKNNIGENGFFSILKLLQTHSFIQTIYTDDLMERRIGEPLQKLDSNLKILLEKTGKWRITT